MNNIDAAIAPNWEASARPRSVQSTTGLRVLLLTLGSLFFLFIISLLSRSQFQDYESLTAAWQPLSEPWMLWINTGLLVAGSVALHWGRKTSQRQQRERTLEALLLGGLFTIAFLIGQSIVWMQLIARGYYIDGNPANGFFFLLTGIHALHLIVGVGVWASVTIKVIGGLSPQKTQLKVKLCAIYWNFLLVVWLVLFSLLISPPGAFEAFATLCGLR